MMEPYGKDTRVVIYPAPAGAVLSDDYSLRVNGKNVDVYRGSITDPQDAGTYSYVNFEVPSFGGTYSFAYFDYCGEVEVEVNSRRHTLENTRIHPESKNVEAEIGQYTLKFVLVGESSYLSIEPDGKNAPLLLFANPLEENVPEPETPCVLYFGPGIHQLETLEVKSGETLYIAGGAIVKAGVLVRGKNIAIRGRGILDGVDWPRLNGPISSILQLDDCENVTVEGIILKDGWGWNFSIHGGRNILIDHFKLIACHVENNDGIDICNSQQVTVKNSFIRSDDDCIAVKGLGYNNKQAVDSIYVHNTTLWTDRAHIWRIGCECRAEAMRNMTFRDIDVIHYVSNWWNLDDLPTCISLQPAEGMLLENVSFENIRIHHEGQEWVMEIKPKFTQWAEVGLPGKIRNCSFRNISIEGTKGSSPGRIHIHGPERMYDVANILFENVVRHGELVTDDSPDVEITGYTSNVSFRGGSW